MTDQPLTLPETLQRRSLIRGGALLAAAGAGAVVAGATTALPAEAANGDTVKVGGKLSGTATTSLTVNAATVPTLTLHNSSGPTLALTALTDFTGKLRVGEIVDTVDGPLIGVTDGGGGADTTILATGYDLDALALPVPLTPRRLVDTRSSASRAKVLDTSSAAFDADGHLVAGAYMDIAVDPASSDFTDVAAFLNVTSVGSLATGYLLAYPPGTRPNASTTSFTAGVTIANGSFVGVSVVAGAFAVRIYASATTHVIVDLTGRVATQFPGPAAAASAGARTSARRRSARRMQRTYGAARR